MAVLYVRCCCRAQAAPAACSGRAVLCAVCYAMCHTMKKKKPRKALLSNNITSILYVLGRKRAHVLILGKKLISRWSFFGIVYSIDVFFSNLTQISTYQVFNS